MYRYGTVPHSLHTVVPAFITVVYRTSTWYCRSVESKICDLIKPQQRNSQHTIIIASAIVYSTLCLRIMDRKRRLDLESESIPKRRRNDLHEGGINPWTSRPYTARYHSILETRLKLPVYQFKDQLLKAVDENQIVVVEGETGELVRQHAASSSCLR
jgi:HrpA-like RNA helicase